MTQVNPIDMAVAEARATLVWLKKTASDKQDYARIVGYEDCLRKFETHLKEESWRNIIKEAIQILESGEYGDCHERVIAKLKEVS